MDISSALNVATSNETSNFSLSSVIFSTVIEALIFTVYLGTLLPIIDTCTCEYFYGTETSIFLQQRLLRMSYLP